MEEVHKSDENNDFFEFSTYEEFTKERLKLNNERTLKLWYTLPSDLSNLGDRFLQRRTVRQQKAILRRVKLLYLYSKLFKRTCIKKRIYSKGEHFQIVVKNDMCIT